jgi:two-component system LytT family response regulator
LGPSLAAPLRVLVVDDEPLARRNLVVLLGGDPDIGEVEECGSGEAAIAAVRSRNPDLVFLDVQMPECDGFEVLERLGGELRATIVFVTAFDEYALRAFDAGALDYLLKPFDDARFARALARAKEKIAREASAPARPVQRLVIKSPGQLTLVEVSKIDWVEAASYYACLHVGRQTHVIRRTLAELERDLAQARFVRIHRSSIVNLDRVRGLELQASGEYEVVLECGARLRLSRSYKKQLQDRLETQA